MSDFTTIRLQANTGTNDASPTWTSISFGGSAGANEVRFCASGAGSSSTASASWPFFTRPSSVGVVPEAWAFTADTTGSKITTYDGTSSHYAQFRWDWDNVGTYAAAPQFGAFGDNTHTTPSPGTQPGGQSGSPIVNGSSGDTSSKSYLKANAYGYGVDGSGNQQTPSANAGGTLSATAGTSGSVSPSSAAWLSTWQDLAGFSDYILDGVVPASLHAGDWYFLLALYCGPSMSTGTLLPVITYQYSYS